MSYIAHLKSLSEAKRADEIKRKIFEFQKNLLNDKSRTKLLNDDNLDSWNEIDEITLESVTLEEASFKCVAEIYWESYGPKDENDERSMCGNAIATLNGDGAVLFSDATVAFDGDAPRHCLEDPNDEDEQQRLQDEQDYTEYLTKD